MLLTVALCRAFVAVGNKRTPPRCFPIYTTSIGGIGNGGHGNGQGHTGRKMLTNWVMFASFRQYN
ncbi:MAG: hypothetical protein CMK02_15115 [Polycyclovorans sp.]|nr:hypothetical protein [Polycyclovorans sp.]